MNFPQQGLQPTSTLVALRGLDAAGGSHLELSR